MRVHSEEIKVWLMTINLPCQLRWVWYGIGVWYIGLQVLADMNNFDDNDANAGLEIIQ